MEIQRVPGACGVAVGVASVLLVPLYFIYSGAPPVWDVYTRDLLNVIICMLLTVFLAGLRELIRDANSGPGPHLHSHPHPNPNPNNAWVGVLVHSAGQLYVAVVLIATSLEAGAVFARPDGTVDPTTDGPLADGSILMHGSIGRALTAVFLCAAGYAIRRGGALPRRLGTAAYLVAAVNLAFVPSIYFGSDAARFYSALGWGNTALTASLVAYWTLAAGIAMLRRQTAAADQGTTDQAFR